MPENLDNLRHSCAHLLAAAVMELWPHAKRTIGPAIENGFYFDFDFGATKISEADFPALEQKMNELLKSWKGFERHELDAQAAKKEYPDNEFKHELIDEFTADGSKVSFYKSGAYWDLCRGGHVEHPRNALKHFKLLSVAGAYWRGNEKNKMLTRIYGTCFPTKKELDAHLHMLEEAKKRDHRKIGQDLDLFTFADEVGPGLPLWKPKGTTIREELETWAKETEKKWGYERVSTPHIAKHTLFEISGHLPYYKDDMYSPMDIDGENYYLKGMNCPHHHMIYKSSPKSYRNLPLRYAEYGMVYRYEQSGTLFGIMRVRALQQNDAHIYCTQEQAEEEFLTVLKLHEYYYNALGLGKEDYYITIGLPDESKRDKYHGDKELWNRAETVMRSAIEKSGIRSVNDVGGAAFYGPKIDFIIRSAVGREFAISTVQLDLYMPTRFNLDYTDQNGNKKLCAVIHRAPLGSHERFIGFLIEHYGGAFPVWLSPVQVALLSVSDQHNDFVLEEARQLKEKGIRVEVDSSSETIGKKIRNAETQKIPYMIVMGEKERTGGDWQVRVRGKRTAKGEIKPATQKIMKKNAFIRRVQKETQKRSA
ncbi:MAG: Threonine-tRNA ligase [Candidatus Magasanikbacteria bacterium GW2011_GWA2_46_17]|uniref:Threonine--tRNA ligase n=1 Tax=Candidatus Magasanikbacteria bacterium GW2011_GWA2_46_17 TaxID=1619042 RepID=A0A0G1P2X1_9BACT|nr:MAG: Threonine-tRNA ligase [Candidatus Magasanikbacteria bacterium GW2011_GWA2_46_17]HBF67169.1 threonine--tRNA ligase [Candidatus Magasanikbacteria bacterium]